MATYNSSRRPSSAYPIEVPHARQNDRTTPFVLEKVFGEASTERESKTGRPGDLRARVSTISSTPTFQSLRAAIAGCPASVPPPPTALACAIALASVAMVGAPPSCIVSTAVEGTMTMVEFERFRPS